MKECRGCGNNSAKKREYCAECTTEYVCNVCERKWYGDRGSELYRDDAYKVIEQYCATCHNKAECSACLIECRSPGGILLLCSACGVMGVSCLYHAGIEDVPEGDWFCGEECQRLGPVPESKPLFRPQKRIKKNDSPPRKVEKDEFLRDMGSMAVDYLIAYKQFSSSNDNNAASHDALVAAQKKLAAKFEERY